MTVEENKPYLWKAELHTGEVFVSLEPPLSDESSLSDKSEMTIITPRE